MAAAAPSTAPANPLEESLQKIAGRSLLPTEAGAASPLSYDPGQGFRAPQADIIKISGTPGTGATVPETWSHDIALENLKREQLQFEYEQSQASIANALKQQEAERAAAENLRQEAQLGLTRATTAQQLATARQAMGSEAQRQAQAKQAMGIAGTAEARAAQQAAQDAQFKAQQMALARSGEERQAIEAFYKYGGQSLAQRQAGAQEAGARFAWQLGAQAPLGPVGTRPPPVAPVVGTAGNQAYAQATGYAGANLGGYGGAPQLVVPYGGNAGARGYVSPQGMYSPSGTGDTRFIGSPGTATFNQSMQAMNPANAGRPSYMWV